MVSDKQTLEDLEFPVILEWLKSYAIGPSTKDKIAQLSPAHQFEEVHTALKQVHELQLIKTEGEPFPSLDYEEFHHEIRLLPIHNAVIQPEGFMRIRRASSITNDLLYFFDKREAYPLLSGLLADVSFTEEIMDAIDTVFDRDGKVKDDASEALSEIRGNIRSLQRQINRNFEKEIRRLAKDNFLGETRETFINDRRVLTILSQYKRKVSGSVVGSSKTGSLTYIEPQVNVPLNNELELLIDDERKEIFKILQRLRKELLVHLELITAYREVISAFDLINAKCRLAIELECALPSIQNTQELELIDAYHPILRKSHKALKKKTLPQRVRMDKFSRMLVISGPNAGGKSITLKSIGLLQVMLQSGLLVPVHPNSKMCVFETVLSDIGDNQSISNELSTYSYRLKRMKTFLDVAHRKTLLLLDEFGTGSDPDLGGALAESIFETLYNKKCFGVITTHYSNIKLKADRLKNAVNGCMLFNTDTLEPLYTFSTGQPGSSFTFEVAEINGIPEEVIERAKEKLDKHKVKMDRLLSELQKEKNYLSELTKAHIEAQEIAQNSLNEYEDKKAYYDQKIREMRLKSEGQNKLLQHGKKMLSFVTLYTTNSRKKNINDNLLEEVKKYLAVEKSKIEGFKKAAVEKAKVRAVGTKSKKKHLPPKKDDFKRDRIVVGSKVKLIATRQTGIVEDISGETVTITFGFARMKVSRDKLMWVE